MFRNYFKVALKSFARYRWNSLFNILGLAIGIACSVYIYTLIKYELEYDRFHNDIDRVYRLCTRGVSRGETTTFACVTRTYSEYILENYEGIEYMARYGPNRPTQVTYNDISFIENRHQYVESDIFNIIKTDFLFGSKETCLDRPNTVVITESVWNKYFNTENPIGELIKIDTAFFEVSGVIKDMPRNSRFQLDFYESWITYINAPTREGWDPGGRFHTTYIKFKPEANIEAFDKWIRDIPELLAIDNEGQSRGEVDIFTQPLKGLHLSKESKMIWDWEDAANPVYVYILFGTVLLILAMSGLNYINLNIASYSVRAREVGIRKTLGARRDQLIYQFIGESISIVFLSHILGIFLLEATLPLLNNMMEMDLYLDYSSPGIWITIFSIIVLLGIGAGSYPAFYLSRFSPFESSRKNLILSTGKIEFKEILIVIQFAMSIILIIGTALIFRQVNYMKNMDMGVSLNNKFIINLPQGAVNSENMVQVKEEFINTGLFSGASISSSVPGRGTYTWNLWPSGEKQDNSHPINCMEADHDYFDLYGLELVAGVKFDKNLGNSSNRGYMQSEESVRVFGWDSPANALTKTIGNYETPVIGIIKNFHYKGLQREIEPLGIFLSSGEDTRYLTLQYNSQGIDGQRIDLIEDKFNELFPGKIFSYFFLEDDFNLQYKSEDKIVRLFVLLTLLAILIACIGLFGMTAFYCLQKEKSMGLRKIFGADSATVLWSLIKRFSIWVAIAFVIAVPLSVIGVRMWLANFAYKTNISFLVIIAAGILSLAITILTVLYHSYRLSRKNPVDIIRYE